MDTPPLCNFFKDFPDGSIVDSFFFVVGGGFGE
jgi:hypothetical protein